MLAAGPGRSLQAPLGGSWEVLSGAMGSFKGSFKGSIGFRGDYERGLVTIVTLLITPLIYNYP